MRELKAGERAPIADAAVSIEVDGPQVAARAGQIGAVLIGLDAARAIPPSFAPIVAVSREMRPGAGFDDAGALRVDFAALPPDVERLLLVTYIVGGMSAGTTFRDFGTLAITLAGYGFPLDLASRHERALILVELYRHGGGWRVMANGQGFTGGIGALASALGLRIEVPDAVGHAPRGGGYDPSPDRRGQSWTGSGFAIDGNHVLTNAHVVDGARTATVSCERLMALGEVLFSDPRSDIALLRVDKPLPAAARFRFALDLHLGEDVVVLGFPLQGLLGSGPQVTGGNVSSLCGIGNDTGVMQFTAPIASGNSGGPILDMSGLVVGQVHASLNLDRIRHGGGSAENVNFGSKAPILRTFLAANGIGCTVSDDTHQRARADIVREAREYLCRVSCEG